MLKALARRLIPSPAQIVAALRSRGRPALGDRSDPALFDPEEIYLARRNPLVQKVVEDVAQGIALTDALRGIPATRYDTRLIEFSYFVSWLLRRPMATDLLCVGPALNDNIISNYLDERCNRIWFCDADRAVNLRIARAFHAGPLAAKGARFDSIAALPPLGQALSDGGVFDKVTVPGAALIRKMTDLLAPGGELLLATMRNSLSAGSDHYLAALRDGSDLAIRTEAFAIERDRWVPHDKTSDFPSSRQTVVVTFLLATKPCVSGC